MEIHTIRVEKKEVGPKFPFDRVYLVKHEDRGQIEHLFRCALVMPLDDKLRAMVAALNLAEVKERPFDRDDEATEVRTPKKNELRSLTKGDWVLVVPILPKWLNGKNLPAGEGEKDGNGQQAPRYLTSNKWWRGKKRTEERTKSPFLPSLSYLQVPGRKIRPICVACPRRVMHENGECQLGQPECYVQLSLGVKNYFREGTNTPINPTITEMLDDGFVPENHA